MFGRLISRFGVTLAWFMPMGTDSSVSRTNSQFTPVEIFVPIPTTPCPPDCFTEMTQEVRPDERHIRTQCGNMYNDWQPASSAPVNRTQRRDPNFGVTTNRDGSIKLPPPHYVALQPRCDGRASKSVYR